MNFRMIATFLLGAGCSGLGYKLSGWTGWTLGLAVAVGLLMLIIEERSAK